MPQDTTRKNPPSNESKTRVIAKGIGNGFLTGASGIAFTGFTNESDLVGAAISAVVLAGSIKITYRAYRNGNHLGILTTYITAALTAPAIAAGAKIAEGGVPDSDVERISGQQVKVGNPTGIGEIEVAGRRFELVAGPDAPEEVQLALA